MFRAPLCPSSGAREYYKSGCCLSYLVLGFQVVGMVWSWELCVRFAGCWSSSTPYRQLENQAPNTTGSNHFYNTLELLMMGIMVPETCWTSNKIYNKNSSVASSWHFISTYYRRCTVKITSNNCECFVGLAIRLQGCVSEESWFDTLLGKTYFSTDTAEGAWVWWITTL
jgi:hypothetical protein